MTGFRRRRWTISGLERVPGGTRTCATVRLYRHEPPPDWFVRLIGRWGFRLDPKNPAVFVHSDGSRAPGREMVDELASRGLLRSHELEALRDWLERLRPVAVRVTISRDPADVYFICHAYGDFENVECSGGSGRVVRDRRSVRVLTVEHEDGRRLVIPLVPVDLENRRIHVPLGRLPGWLEKAAARMLPSFSAEPGLVFRHRARDRGGPAFRMERPPLADEPTSTDQVAELLHQASEALERIIGCRRAGIRHTKDRQRRQR